MKTQMVYNVCVVGDPNVGITTFFSGIGTAVPNKEIYPVVFKGTDFVKVQGDILFNCHVVRRFDKEIPAIQNQTHRPEMHSKDVYEEIVKSKAVADSFFDLEAGNSERISETNVSLEYSTTPPKRIIEVCKDLNCTCAPAHWTCTSDHTKAPQYDYLLIFFDLNSQESLFHVIDWYVKATEFFGKRLPTVVCGNKQDALIVYLRVYETLSCLVPPYDEEAHVGISDEDVYHYCTVSARDAALRRNTSQNDETGFNQPFIWMMKHAFKTSSSPFCGGHYGSPPSTILDPLFTSPAAQLQIREI